MTTAANEPLTTAFANHRDHLRAVAYRMLGTVTETEDVLQDAYLRVSTSDPTEIINPRAYLSQVVTRLCLDHLRSARVRREQYVGPWLPEPLVVESECAKPPEPEQLTALREDVSIALMLALERLSPLERAAFILHDIFDVEYPELALVLGREEAACRQLAARGRRRVRESRPRRAATQSAPPTPTALLTAFTIAARDGDIAKLERVLAEDVAVTADGGGRVTAATKVVRGRHNVVRLILGLMRHIDPRARLWPATVNGHPGLVLRQGDTITQTIAFEICDGQIAHIYTVRNPDKLRHLAVHP
ncbi:MAG: sigma-70 family RNA polymerase sigma factor [Myxococcales bacterium FL481]|nr:MAG: sigma-70 family RNA polymerase sigma factor [Myxococcales bacterium FL481]